MIKEIMNNNYTESRKLVLNYLISNLLENLELVMFINIIRGKIEAILQREVETAEAMGSFRNSSSWRTEKLKKPKCLSIHKGKVKFGGESKS